MSATGQGVYYRALSSLDMEKVVRLHRRVFPPDQLRSTIFYSPRVKRYFSALAAHPGFQRGHQFWGAWSEGELVAYAHYRILKDSLHLNQVAVCPEYQARKIGSSLVEIWKHQARLLGLSLMSLDVDKDNVVAYNWYLRMGLRPVYETFVYECKISGLLHPRPVKFYVLDWEHTKAWQEAYGFSKIHVEFGDRLWEIGWIWKALHVQDEFPSELLSGLLSILDGVRFVFVKSQKRLETPCHGLIDKWRLVGVRVRMQASLEEVF